jgi:putative hydrolase of the HAD superfamily
LLCDLDNTIIDRAAAFRAWATDFATGHGHDAVTVEWLVAMDGDGYGDRDAFFAGVRDRFGLAEPVEEIVADYYRSFLPRFRCEEHVRDALAEARRGGWRIAIVTNGPATQEDKIRHAGLEALVDAWCVSEVEGHSKPDVRLLEIAAARCDTTLTGAWMIGDNPDTDIAAAHEAGLASVWLRHGRVWSRDGFAPTHVAESFAEAVAHVLASEEGPQWG